MHGRPLLSGVRRGGHDDLLAGVVRGDGKLYWLRRVVDYTSLVLTAMRMGGYRGGVGDSDTAGCVVLRGLGCRVRIHWLSGSNADLRSQILLLEIAL